MTNITEQGIVDKLLQVKIDKMKLEIEISEYDKALQCTAEYIKLQELQNSLRDLNKNELELKDEGKNILINSGIKKFEALDGTIIQLNKKPGKLIIENENNILLDDYWKEKITRTLDKKQIKEDIKEGVIIDGVYIEEDYSLVIKNK